MSTYELVEEGKAIKCLLCELTSYHPEDVRQHYCGRCRLFHDDLEKLGVDVDFLKGS
jgi:hypothetical protein